MNSLEEEWKKEKLWKWFLDKNGIKFYDQAFKELEESKKKLPWYRRWWNTKRDLDLIQKRTEEIANKEYRRRTSKPARPGVKK